MKKTFWCALFSLSALVGCTVESYESGDGEYSLLTAELVDAHTNANARVDYAETDGGERLTFAQPAEVKWMVVPDTTYRAAIYYKVENGASTLFSAGRVGILSPHSISDMRTDPVGLESIWVAASKRYLNLSLNLMTGAVDDEEIHHTISCRRDTLLTNPDGTRTLCLTLYHDQSQVPEYYTQRSFFSIPLQTGESDSIRFTINTYNGKTVKTLAR